MKIFHQFQPIATLQKQNVTVYFALVVMGTILEKETKSRTGLQKHDSREDQSMHQHLSKCDFFMEIAKLIKLLGIDSMSTSVVKKEYLLNALLSNFHIVGSCRN